MPNRAYRRQALVGNPALTLGPSPTPSPWPEMAPTLLRTASLSRRIPIAEARDRPGREPCAGEMPIARPKAVLAFALGMAVGRLPSRTHLSTLARPQAFVPQRAS